MISTHSGACASTVSPACVLALSLHCCPPCVAGVADGRYRALLDLDGSPDAASLQQVQQLQPLLAAAIGGLGVHSGD